MAKNDASKNDMAKNDAAKINTAEPRQASRPIARPKIPKASRRVQPRPPDSHDAAAARRRLQSAVSSTMKINIDKWAGSFEGQQRRKLEILIDPVMKELDATLAKAVEELRPASDMLSQAKKARARFSEVASRGRHANRARPVLVADLVQKSDGTPYAFIGLQLVDITELHISPARLDVKSAKNETPRRKDQVQEATVHLIRAREMLTELTKKYESVKRDLQLAEDMQRIKNMYQVFIEDAMIFLAASRSELNPKNRKMAELELDEEFMKQYRELAQEWEKTLAELAKALAKDPRLLARYMNLSRRRVDSLRDQMTLLNLKQQELLVPVQRLTGRRRLPDRASRGSGRPEGRRTKIVPQRTGGGGQSGHSAFRFPRILAQLPPTRSVSRRIWARGCLRK